VVGISVVFSALVLIGSFIALLGRIFSEKPDPVAAEPVLKPVEGVPQSAQINPQTLAVLTAAAVAAVGRPVRLQRITFINHNTISAWAERGRVSIHGSHNVRRTL